MRSEACKTHVGRKAGYETTRVKREASGKAQVIGRSFALRELGRSRCQSLRGRNGPVAALRHIWREPSRNARSFAAQCTD